MKKISIVTINYNNKNGLKRTIESVIAQSYTDLEYIVIDGGSTDGSADVLKHYSDRITYWVSEKDNGIYNAMNKGIKVAKGEYCLFLNSGDYLINNEILEKVSSELKGEEIIYGNGEIESKDGNLKLIEIPQELKLDYFSGNSLFHPASFIKRDLFETYGLYNESNKIVSDWEFFIKTIFIYKVKARKIPFEIAVAEDDGISRSAAGRQILKQEIDKVLTNYFPAAVVSLINENKKKKDLTSGKKVQSARTEKLIYLEKYPFAFRFVSVVMDFCLFFLPRKNKNDK